ncbi:hypothetical protein BSKO_11545 [Bryopsis sp. KO-2023]|nr:hypothetical protein BSKO_11545 [Bryopsis sp. KO-2023]
MGSPHQVKRLPENDEDEYPTDRASPRNAPSSSYFAHQTQARKQYVERSVKDFRERHLGSKSDPPQPMGAKDKTTSLVQEAHRTPLPMGRVAYPHVTPPPDPPSDTGVFGCFFWMISGAVLLVGVVAVIRNPDFDWKSSFEQTISEFKAERNQVDYRVLALDFLRTWALENDLPSRWSNELEDALMHVEDSESRDPRVGTGVLLSCKVEQNCRNMMNKLEGHLLEQAAATANKCVLRLDHSIMDGEDLDGQVQHRIVQALKPCQKAVVIVDDAHRMPYKAAKVFTNALSEMGGFIDWGKHVPSTNALYLMSTVAQSDANMSLENFMKVAKDNLVKGLSKVDRLLNKGEAQTNMPAINAGALRRRLSWVIPVDPVK